MKETPVVKLEEVLRLAIEMNATDIHIQVGLPPMFRVRGKLVPHESSPLAAEQCEALAFSIMSEEQKKTFSERLDCDFSYGIVGLARFRINVFRQRASVAVVTQQLMPRRDNEGMALAMEMLMVSPAIRNLIREGKTFQIQSLLQTGSSSGMLTMENSLKGLVEKGWISAADAIEHCFDPKEMARVLGRR